MKIGVGKVIKNKQNWILIIWSMNIKYKIYYIQEYKKYTIKKMIHLLRRENSKIHT